MRLRPVTQVLLAAGTVVAAVGTGLVATDSAGPLAAIGFPLGWALAAAGAWTAVRDLRTHVDGEAAAATRRAEAAVAAEDANRVKSEFLTNMSHEIRTPMNAVIGLADILGGTELPRESAEHVELLRSSARHLLELLDSVLDFSKIEAGRVALESRPFLLAEVLGQAVRALAVRARPNVEVVLDVAPELLCSVRGDDARLRQIVDNLLYNAIKFTEDGEIVVSAALESETQTELEVRVTVRDTGAGIPKDRQRAIFEAFTQADGSISRRFGGTGLGLSIASRLAQLLGGQIWVESVQGLGSSFHFTARFAREPGSVQVPALDGRVVLVVDDHAAARDSVTSLLVAEGARVLSCVDAHHARAVLAGAERVDLALIDTRLGVGTDGLDLAAEISDGSFGTAGIRTIMLLPTNARSADVEQCRLVGAHSWIYKPVVHRDLLAATTELLAGRARDEEGTSADLAPSTAPRRPLRILAAEDNLVNQHLLKSLMAQRGHQLVLVSDGREALRRAEEPFDLILMDVQMPGLDGLEATRAIRSREKRSGAHVPIVAMTAHAMDGDRERCLAAGMDRYLSKPLRVDELFRVVESFEASAQRTPAAIDRDEALLRVHGNTELHAELVALFRSEAPRAVAQLRAAVQAANLVEIERSTHALKTSTGVIGGVRARDAAAVVEAAARDGAVDAVLAAMPELDAALGELMDAAAGQRPEVVACAS